MEDFCALSHVMNSLDWGRRMSKVDVISKSMHEVQEDCKAWAKEISNSYWPDVIIFIAKSGYLFAEPMAKIFNVPMADILVMRPGNTKKDMIKKLVPRIPKPILYMSLKSKFMYGYNDKNNEREVRITERLRAVDFSKVNRILIIDDSVDTGWSILQAEEVIKELAPNAEVKVAGYCVIDMSEGRVHVDFYRYRNEIVITATSRYSNENQIFLDSYERWKDTANTSE